MYIIESVVKKISPRKQAQGQIVSVVNYTKHLQNNQYQPSQSLPPRENEEKRTLTNSLYEASQPKTLEQKNPAYV